MGQSISLQLQRTLSIAPALQRSLQLLQMNALEFEQEISQALSNNPLLEMDEGADGASSDGATAESPGADGDVVSALSADGSDGQEAFDASAEAATYGDDPYDAPDSYEHIASDAVGDMGDDYGAYETADHDVAAGADGAMDGAMMDSDLPGAVTAEA